MLDRVLSRKYKERAGQLIGLLFDGDMTFRHGFQQRRLSLWRGSVNLVGQHDVGEDRARLELKRALFLIEDFEADDIRRQQIGSELNPLEAAIEASGEGLGERGLADAGHVFDQEVPAGEKGHEREFDDIGLAPNHALDCRLELFEPPGGGDQSGSSLELFGR